VSRGWNISEIFDEIRATIPDAPALIHGDVERTWNVMHQRSESLAAIMLASGVSEQSKVAQYLYNGPEYLESVLAAFSAGLAVVNTNYRYAADELVYLWDNADVEIVVFHGSFTERIEEIRDRVSDVKLWIRVDDDSTALPNWAIDYETIVSAPPVGPAHGPWGRSGDHLLLLYTGGTTGMPKGVMWRQDDLVGALDASNRRRLPELATPGAVAERLSGPGPRGLPGAPLMHGTGFFNAISTMMLGGSTTTLTGRRFDVNELLDTIEQRRINSISIVGDAFAKPMLAALDAEPKRWDLSSLRVIVSSGVMWARTTKEGLLRHNPRLIMVDTLGSSEAIGMASNVSTRESIGARGGTARFELGPNTRVVDDAGNDVQRGSGQRGRVALRGRTPIGYYKDAEKSAATFQVIDGVRYSIPGDWAEVETDGTVVLLGRGSQCINTGGEKVYPEEVEEIIKTMPTVRDCAVVGVPDDRFGEAICAIVETDDGSKPELSQISHHVRQHLAGYKVPRHVVHVSSVGRAVNGKLDYRTLRTEALERIDGA
jgi:acyl-CoA synthetase (AMP-forming)/AMP-acid ligase II